MAYLLDANVFIEAKNRYYGLDFCPGFWDWLVDRNAAGAVFSIEKVADELAAGIDELADWADRRGAGFFLKPDQPVVTGLVRVSQWAKDSGFDAAAVSTFLDAADSYLIAHALAHRHTVVTHERVDGSKKKIKIPVACIPLGVKFMSPFEMLRKERALFVLEKRS